MNVINVDSAARASSCDGGEVGEWLPMMGLVLALKLEGGAMDRGDGLVMGVGMVLLRLEWWMDESVALRGETSISSWGDSRDEEAMDCGSCLEVTDSGEESLPISGTVCRRRSELAGARGGRRAIF